MLAREGMIRGTSNTFDPYFNSAEKDLVSLFPTFAVWEKLEISDDIRKNLNAFET